MDARSRAGLENGMSLVRWFCYTFTIKAAPKKPQTREPRIEARAVIHQEALAGEKKRLAPPTQGGTSLTQQPTNQNKCNAAQ